MRATALSRLGRDIGEDLDVALVDARATAEPALILHAMRAFVGVRPDEQLATEARELVRVIATTLADETLRARFLERAAI